MKQVDNILIIDDDPLFLLLIKKTIIKYELSKTISAFTDGVEALESLKDAINNHAQLPDILLLDINMPIMDGWEFLDLFKPLLKTIDKKISIYIATSSIAEDDKLKAKSFSIVKDYLLKPIDQQILNTIIDEHNHH